MNKMLAFFSLFLLASCSLSQENEWSFPSGTATPETEKVMVAPIGAEKSELGIPDKVISEKMKEIGIELEKRSDQYYGDAYYPKNPKAGYTGWFFVVSKEWTRLFKDGYLFVMDSGGKVIAIQYNKRFLMDEVNKKPLSNEQRGELTKSIWDMDPTPKMDDNVYSKFMWAPVQIVVSSKF